MAKGLYLIYTNNSGDNRDKVYAFTFEGEEQVMGHDRDAGEGKEFRLRCPCDADNWTDNGRSMHEYECDSCGEFVEVLIK